jgi:hypothetical protein
MQCKLMLIQIKMLKTVISWKLFLLKSHQMLKEQVHEECCFIRGSWKLLISESRTNLGRMFNAIDNPMLKRVTCRVARMTTAAQCFIYIEILFRQNWASSICCIEHFSSLITMNHLMALAFYFLGISILLFFNIRSFFGIALLLSEV